MRFSCTSPRTLIGEPSSIVIAFQYVILTCVVCHRLQDNHDDCLDAIDGLREPFALDHLPDGMMTDDHIDQAQVYESIFAHHARTTDAEEDERRWDATPRIPLRLSVLKAAATKRSNHRTQDILMCLKKRTHIVVDDDMMIPPTHQSLKWKASGHFVDFLMCVPAKPGLAVCLPTIEADHNYTLDLDIQQGYRHFKPKHGKIGFNTDGRVVYMGRSRNDELWCAFAPNSFLEEHPGDEEDESTMQSTPLFGITKGDSRLTPSRLKVWQLFMCHMLEAIQYRGINILPHCRYGTSNDFRKWKIQDVCDV